MQFLSRFFGSDSGSKVSQVHLRDRSPRRRRAQFSLETLEDRDLKSNLPGVELMHGALHISATQAGNNTASVDYTDNGNIKVTLNDQSVEYDLSQVGPLWSVTYSGDQRSQGGGDSFTNNTDLTSSVSMYGGDNTVVGGSSWDFVLVTGDHNYVDTQTGGGMVYNFAGPSDSITSKDDVRVFSYSWDPYVYAKWYN